MGFAIPRPSSAAMDIASKIPRAIRLPRPPGRHALPSGALAALLLLAPLGAVEAEAPRDPGRIVYLGDSRLAAQFDDPEQRVASARFFGNAAAQRLGQRLRTAANPSVAGFRSDQFLTDWTVAKALATDALWVAIFGVVNDATQRGPQSFFEGYPGGPPGGVRAKVEQLRAGGMRPILVLEPGAAGLRENDAIRASIEAYNAAVRTYAAQHPDVVVFDMPAAVLEEGEPGRYRPGYATDGTHLDTLGGVAAGEAFAALMAPLITAVPAVDPAAGGSNLARNGTFAEGTGGIAAEGVQGTVPAAFSASCTPGLRAVVAAGPAPGQVSMAVAASGPGICTLSNDLSGEAEGQAFEAFATAQVAEGATGLAGPFLQLQSQRDERSLDAFDNYWSASGPGPSEARDLALRTPVLTVPPGRRGWFAARVGAAFAGPGLATVSFSSLSVVPSGRP
ncbi:SGNH/GDSL hydrolase family protein [Aureimonas sp. SK2]|uniref:SGNH/GDSL hydrolase family protein n=1 Tax=Aureimonas sp. SK2 TaxID=3015992 RepID=UPI0024438638|nr:SGNH/GDSL hydrolase family protein [Aureimonas sp. SK2]